MRSTLLILLLSLAVGSVYFVKSRPGEPVAVVKIAANDSKPQVSEHNWPKNALDRAAELKTQVNQQRKDDNTR